MPLARHGNVGSDVVRHAADASLPGAVRAAKHLVIGLHAVTDDPGAAVLADRCQLVDRTFEAVERVRATVARHLETALVFIATGIASSHQRTSPFAAHSLHVACHPEPWSPPRGASS